MTPERITESYLRHEKRLGGPDAAKDALEATAEELGLSYMQVYDRVFHSPLMAGSGGMG